MKRMLVMACLLLLFAVVGGMTLQSTGTLVCEITDSNGDPLPGAVVTVTSENTERSAVSRENGQCLFRELQPGEYTVLAQMSGFQTEIREGVAINPAEVTRITIVLEVETESEVP